MALDVNKKLIAVGDKIIIIASGTPAVVIAAEQTELGHNVLAQLPAEKDDVHPRYVPLLGSQCKKEHD